MLLSGFLSLFQLSVASVRTSYRSLSVLPTPCRQCGFYIAVYIVVHDKHDKTVYGILTSLHSLLELFNCQAAFHMFKGFYLRPCLVDDLFLNLIRHQ